MVGTLGCVIETLVLGGFFNLGTYFVLVTVLPGLPLVLGVAAGSLAGMSCNFLTSRFLLFRVERGS